MGGPRLNPATVQAVRDLKAKKATDVEIARALNLTMDQVSYIRSKYGIGGRYAIYKEQSFT